MELAPLLCPGRDGHCRALLGMVALAPGSAVEVKCPKCNRFTRIGGPGTTVTMLARTRARIDRLAEAA